MRQLLQRPPRESSSAAGDAVAWRAMQTCSACGTTADVPDGEVPLGWMVEREDAGTVLVCSVCTREHVRAIEGKLDRSWW